MYRVKVITDGEVYSLHEPNDDTGELQLLDPKLTQEMGESGRFEFRITDLHPNKDMIHVLKSEILVYDEGEIIFAGRHIGDEKDFNNTGSVTCEGELAYLLDSMQRPFDYMGSGTEFLKKLLKIHNEQVEERKRFEVGMISVADTAPEIHRAESECKNTLEIIRTHLVGINGGYMRIRREQGKKYLDYLHDFGGINEQPIRFGENMLDMTRFTKPTSIITALIPYGAEIEPEDDTEEAKRVDITGVNGGKDSIFDQDAVNTYGWIWGSQTFDDITDSSALLLKARAYLQEAIAMPVTIELRAVDLGLVEVEAEKLKLGYWTNVISIPHRISKRFLLSKKIIHLDNPGKDEIVLGATRKSFTSKASKDKMEISDRVNRVANSLSKEILRKIQNATDLITGGTGGYLVIDIYDPVTGKKKHPWRMLIMDTPDQETAKYVWQFNMNGLGFSRTGINGPYENAWTIDGNLVADFITTGTMLADRIRGGVLELGGEGLGRDGAIKILSSAGKLIGTVDKNGVIFRDGQYIGGMIDIGDGLLYVDQDIVKFGDYRVSTDGTNALESANGYVKFNCEGRPDGSPGLDYASLFIGGGKYAGVEILGTGKIDCGGIECSDVILKRDWAEGMTLFEMLNQIYDRLNQLKNHTDYTWD